MIESNMVIKKCKNKVSNMFYVPPNACIGMMSIPNKKPHIQ